jgi:hypothetical protein
MKNKDKPTTVYTVRVDTKLRKAAELKHNPTELRKQIAKKLNNFFKSKI